MKHSVQDANQVYVNLTQIRPSPTISDVVAALKVCSTSRDLTTGIKIHSYALQHTPLHASIFISNTLIDMYSKCGDLPNAQTVFQTITSPTVVSWNTIILGHADVGDGATALELFSAMQNQGFKPDARTFVGVFKALVRRNSQTPEKRIEWLKLARALHSQATGCGHRENIFIANTLVDMYSKLGSLKEARKVFDDISNKCIVSWNALMMGCVEGDEGDQALELFAEMQRLGFKPNDLTYTAAFKACASSSIKEQAKMVYLEKGKHIHKQLTRECRELDMFLASTLVDFYTKYGCVEEAWTIFERMKVRDMVTWSTIIMGYAENGDGVKALKLFERMREGGYRPDAQAFLGAIKACACLGSRPEAEGLDRARELQVQVGELGYQDDKLLVSAMIDMFAKCGSLVDALKLFKSWKTTSPTTQLWNSMLLAYAEFGEVTLALKLFQDMEKKNFSSDSRTYIAMLKACANSGGRKQSGRTSNWLQTGADFHKRAEKNGLGTDPYVVNAVLEMYIKCGSLDEAEKVFETMEKKTLVSWNLMILGYADAGKAEQVFKLFDDMQTEGFRPASRTYVGVFKACGMAAGTTSETRKEECLERARSLHRDFARSGEGMDVFVASSLVEMYSKCGSMPEARQVVGSLKESHRDSSMPWTSLIAGYVENGEQRLALESFHEMKERGIQPHTGAFVVSLNACGGLAWLETGRELHGEVCVRGVEVDPVVSTCLIDFYGKCGDMEKAQLVFDSMQQQADIIPWNALITGYAQLGHTEQVFELFKRMNVEPNSVTFLNALAVCSRAGLVEEGRGFFREMEAPGVEHYSCMVDMLCRANRLDEAVQMVKSMPLVSNSRIWTTILDAASKSGDHKVGKLAFESQMKMEECGQDGATFVLMANGLRQP